MRVCDVDYGGKILVIECFVRIIVLLIIVSVLPLQALAQAVGQIVGTVTDASGALVPGAKVTATCTGTQIPQSTVTSGSGTYFIPNLPVCTYNVTAVDKGFRSGMATEITLDLSQPRLVL